MMPLGLPVRFAIGPGQQNDMAAACGWSKDYTAHRYAL